MTSCNSYGWSGGFAALCAFLSWWLVLDKSCTINLTKTLFGNGLIVVGIVLFALSFFNFAETLAEIRIIFILAVVGIFTAGGLLLYSAYTEFYISCTALGFFTQGNVFDGNDTFGISIFIIDILGGLLLISAAISFARGY